MFLCAYRIIFSFFSTSNQTNAHFQVFFYNIFSPIFTYFSFCILFCIVIFIDSCDSVCFFMLCLRDMVFVVYCSRLKQLTKVGLS